MTIFEKGPLHVVLSLEQQGRVLRIERRTGTDAPVIDEKSFLSPIRARWEHDRTVKHLLDDGFQRALGEASGPSVDGTELEELLDEGPRIDVDSALVYADFLQENDDPRGELILLQHRRAGNPPSDEKKRLYHRETELLFRHRHHLLGHLGTRLLDEDRQRYAIDELEVSWVLGFFEEVRIRRDYFAHANGQDALSSISELLKLLADSPSARFLRRLEISPLLDSDRFDAVEALESIPLPPSLRELSIGGIQDDYGRSLIGFSTAFVRFNAFLARQPRLEKLLLNGIVPIEEAQHPLLRELSVRAQSLSGIAVETIADGRWPALRRLTLGGQPNDATDAHRIERAVRRLLDNPRAPALTALALEAMHPIGPVLDAILESSFLGRATELAITDTNLDEDIVARLVSDARLHRLERLDLSYNRLADVDRRILRQHYPTAKLLVRGQAGAYLRPDDEYGEVVVR